jgi:tRNA(Arg) A34 adenosine deaminase TadA
MLHYLNLAAEVADLTVDIHRKAFVGAVAIRRDGVIVSTRNAGIRNPTERCPAAHAEARLCRKSGMRAIIYVARVRRDGSLALACPCETCFAYLKSMGAEAVYYTISNTEWGGFKF